MISKRSFLMALVAAALSSCGPPKTGICDAHRHGAALVTRYVVVYGRTASRATTSYFGCLRPAGRPVDVGIDELAGLYGSDATTGGFSAAGSYVVAQSSTGEAALAVCARYTNPRRCTPDRHWLTVVNLKAGRQARLPVYSTLSVPTIVPFPVTVALSPTGAVAWLERRTAGARLTGAFQLWATRLESRGSSSLEAVPLKIDTGSIDRSSVRFDGVTLYWIRGHKPHRRELH